MLDTLLEITTPQTVFMLDLEIRKVSYARMECLKEYSKTISTFLNRHMQMLFHMCCEIRPNMSPHCSSV